MIDQNKINELLKSIESLTKKGDSPQLDTYWEELVDLFSANLKETKEYLGLRKEEEILVLADFFEDISCELQSKEFVRFLRELQLKYPNLDLEQDITWAEEAIT